MKKLLLGLLLLPLSLFGQQEQRLGSPNTVVYAPGMIKLDSVALVIPPKDTNTVKTAYPSMPMKGRVAWEGTTPYVHNGVGFVSFGGGIENITGLITAGQNIQISGTGTGVDPYEIAADNVDTTEFATLYNVNDLGKTYPQEGTFGTIFSQDKFSASDLSLFAPSGGCSVALTGDDVDITSSTIAWNSIVRFMPNRPTLLNKWSYTVEYQLISALGGSNIGFGLALRSNNIVGANYGYACYLSATSGTATINIAKEDGTGSTAGGSFAISQNDVIRMTLSRTDDSTITVSAQNVTTSSSVATASLALSTSATLFPPNTGTFGFQNFGGTYRVRSINITSDAVTSPTLLVAFDSKGQIYANNFWRRFAGRLEDNYPTVVNYSGGGDRLQDLIDKKEELLRINPEQIWIGLGSNDIRFGASLTETLNRMAKLNGIFTGTSTKFLVSVIPEDSTGAGIGLTAFNAACSTLYPTGYIDLWTSVSTNNILDAIYNQGDDVHPNDAAQPVFEADAIASGLISTQSPNRRSPYQTTDGNVVATGNKIGLAWDVTKVINNVPRWDDSLNIVPSFMFHNNEWMMFSANMPNATRPVSSPFLTINGSTAITGGNAGLLLYDRGTPTNFHSFYSNSNYLRLSYNGTDNIWIDPDGKIKIGASVGTPTIYPALQVKKDVTSDSPTKATGLSVDSSTATLSSTAAGDGTTIRFEPHTFTGLGLYDNLSTLEVLGSPYVSGGLVATNLWSLRVASGKSYMGGQLEINTTTGGFIPPRMTATQASALTPVEGMLIYVTDTNGTFTAKGWWGYEGSVWQQL